jgi:hypothetical protein
MKYAATPFLKSRKIYSPPQLSSDSCPQACAAPNFYTARLELSSKAEAPSTLLLAKNPPTSRLDDQYPNYCASPLADSALSSRGCAANGSIDLGGRGVLSSPGRSMNSMIAIFAASPNLLRVRTTRVYPPSRVLYLSASSVKSLCCSSKVLTMPWTLILEVSVFCSATVGELVCFLWRKS